MTGSALIGGYATGLPVQIPMIDIQEVGTGGGSIARVEVGGALHVGPESAGAQPGPVCYGLGGTEPTITDANLILGRLGADRFLGGEMQLDLERRERALEERVAEPLGLDLDRRRPTASCASPPPRCPTWCAGSPPSAGSMPPTSRWSPMAAPGRCMPRWSRASCASPRSWSRARPGISPPTACWSPTCGAISSTPGSRRSPRRRSRPWRRSTPRWSGAAARRSADSRVAIAGVAVQRSADMRYVGQEHAVTVELPLELFRAQDRDGIKQRFDAVHETRYGYSAPAREGRDRQPAQRRHRPDAQARLRADRGRRGRAAGRGLSRHPAGLFRRSRPARRHADLRPRRRCWPATASPGRR